MVVADTELLLLWQLKNILLLFRAVDDVVFHLCLENIIGGVCGFVVVGPTVMSSWKARVRDTSGQAVGDNHRQEALAWYARILFSVV